MAEVKGKVLDNEEAELIMANVELTSAKDSSLVKAGLTDSEGKFVLVGVPAGDYFVKISYVGMAPFNSERFSVASGEEKILEDIQMQASGVELDEVEIRAQKPLVTVKPDMTVFNVQNSTIGIGTDAFDLLRKSPGVIVDNNDNVMLQGKSGVRIMIDGKPSPLSAADLAAFLKSVQSSEIEAIEIITNPSAKYDAEGNAGILNIRMKRDKNLGTSVNASLGYNQGIYAKYNGSLSVNYRSKHSSAFGSYSVGDGLRRNWMDGYREQLGVVFESPTYTLRDYTNHNFRGGADFYIGKYHTIGFVASGFLNDGSSNTYGKSYISDLASGNPISVLVSESINPGYNRNGNGNINYRFDNKKGKKISVDLDYGLFRNNTDSYQPNIYMDPTEEFVQSEAIFSTEAPTDIDIATAKADYETPFLKGSLGFGAKFSQVRSDNIFNFYDEVNGVDTLNLERSNQFIYTENVSAGYITYSRQIKKWAFNAGLRAEHTKSLGDLQSAQETELDRVDRNYLNFFPSGGATYNLNYKNSFRLNYSRRIDRPRYENLNPFEYKINELAYRAGNPFLQPQYTHSIQFTHTYKYTLNSSISYSRTDDFFTQITDTTETNRTYLTTENLSTRDVYNATVSYPFSPTKWWNTYTNMGLTHLRNRADFGVGKEIDITATTYNVFHQSTFTLPKDFLVELSGFYTSPGIWGANFRNKHFAAVNVGVIKRFLEGRGSIKVAVSDVFRQSWWRGVQEFGILYIDVSGGWESRQFKVNLSYLFGNSQMKKIRNRKTGMEDEGSRAGGGGGGQER